MALEEKVHLYLAFFLFFSSQQLFAASEERAGEAIHREKTHSVILLGERLAGKSTLLNHFLGHEFEVEQVVGSIVRVTDIKDSSKTHAPMSPTKNTELFSLETQQGNITFWDTPGFNDDTVTPISLRKTLEVSKKFPHSYIFVLPAFKIRAYRGGHFAPAIYELLKLFTEEEIYQRFRSNFHLVINLVNADTSQETRETAERLLKKFEENFKEQLQYLEEKKEEYETTLQKENVKLPETYDNYKKLIEDYDNVSYEAREALEELWGAKRRRVFLKAYELIKKGILHLHYWHPLEDIDGFKEAFFKSLEKTPKTTIHLEPSEFNQWYPIFKHHEVEEGSE